MKLTHPGKFWSNNDVTACECSISVLHTEAEHNLLVGKEIKRRCSVCNLDWGDGAVSQHQGCALLYNDGNRTYAKPIVYVDGERVDYDD